MTAHRLAAGREMFEAQRQDRAERAERAAESPVSVDYALPTPGTERPSRSTPTASKRLAVQARAAGGMFEESGS